MPNQDDKFWADIAGKLRRVLRLHELTQEEAEQEYEAAEEVPLSDERIDAIVDAAVSGEPAVWESEPDTRQWSGDLDTASIDNQVGHLNRNPGEPDEEVDERIEKYRREVFNDDDEIKRDKPTGVDGGEEPDEGGD